MTAKMLMGLALFAIISLRAAEEVNFHGVPYHPYRKVEGMFYSVQPLYDWIRLSTYERRQYARPMPAWRVEEDGRAQCYVLSVVIGKGLLLKKDGEVTGFLKNYPGSDDQVDSARIRFVALRVGTYQYESAAGATRTVPLYDYGTPYDPFKMAAEPKRTNSPPPK